MIEIDYRLLSETALDYFLTEVVSREGTDYGEAEIPVEIKKQQLKGFLRRREALIVYDLNSGFCDILSV